MHLARSRTRGPIQPARIFRMTEIANQRDSQESVVTAGVCSLATLWSSRLHRPVRKYYIVIGHVVDAPEAKDLKAATGMKFVDHLNDLLTQLRCDFYGDDAGVMHENSHRSNDVEVRNHSRLKRLDNRPRVQLCVYKPRTAFILAVEALARGSVGMYSEDHHPPRSCKPPTLPDITEYISGKLSLYNQS